MTQANFHHRSEKKLNRPITQYISFSKTNGFSPHLQLGNPNPC